MKYRIQPGSGNNHFSKNNISPVYQCSIDASFQKGQMGLGIFFETLVGDRQAHCVRVQRIGKDSTEAELYGLYYALSYALQHNVRSLEVFTDSSMAIHHLASNSEVYSIIPKIISLIDEFEAFSFKWIARERNSAANYLARYSLQLPSSLPDKFSYLRQTHDVVFMPSN